jgi:type III pantothenate kinase
VILDHHTKIPVKNKYDTPETLGKDRIAAVSAAYKLFTKNNHLVIDIGTCMTLDFVTKAGNYLGGNISPGVNLRLRAMHEFTSSLPLVKFDKTKKLLGKSTNEAIKNGAVYGITTEIESYIRRLEIKYDNINVILTGGDATFFGELIDYQIFVDPNLVLKGLNEILKINI